MGCQCCPYGPLITIPILFGFFAMVLAWTSTWGCDLFNSTFEDGTGRSIGPWTVTGPYAVQNTVTSEGMYITVYTVCYTWGSVLNERGMDQYIVTARVFSMIAIILSIVLFIVMMFPACCSFGDNTKIFVFYGVLGGFTGICLLLTLIAMASSLCRDARTCSLGWTGIVCIVAGVLWLLVSCCLCAMPKNLSDDYYDTTPVPVVAGGETAAPVPREEKPMVPATTGVAGEPAVEKTVTQQNNGDGTITVTTTTTTTNPDGSKTVTEEQAVEPDPESRK